MTKRIVTFTALAFFAVTGSAVTPGQIDDFESGSTQGWQHGPASIDPPFQEENCGVGMPASDCLKVNSGFNAQPKLAFFNTNQWTGDYSDDSVLGIRLQVRNNGSNALTLRLGFREASSGSRPEAASIDTVTVPANSDYVEGFIRITPATVAGIGDNEDRVEEILADVGLVMIAHYPDEPVGIWQPADIEASIDVDNIELVTGGGNDLIFSNGFEL